MNAEFRVVPMPVRQVTAAHAADVAGFLICSVRARARTYKRYMKNVPHLPQEKPIPGETAPAGSAETVC
jgi:hypothetical protein